jgi:hypothetical protein
LKERERERARESERVARISVHKSKGDRTQKSSKKS